MVTLNNGSHNYHQTHLKNENTSITELSQGKRKGIIAETGDSWHNQSFSEEPDATAAQFEYQATLKGEWEGLGRDVHQMAANELIFESKQKNEQFDFRQKLKVDFEKQEPNDSRINSYDQRKVVAEVGVSLKDQEGNAWAELDHAQTFVDGEISYETHSRLKASESIELSGAISKEDNASDATVLGLSYAPELDEHMMRLDGEIQRSRTQDDTTQGLSASASIDDLNINYSQEKTSQRESVDGIQTGQVQEFLGLNYTLFEGDLSLAYSQQNLLTNTPDYNEDGEAIAGYEQVKNREVTASYQLSKDILLGASHSAEQTTSSALPGETESSESNKFSAQYSFDEHWKGEAAYTFKPNVSKQYSGRLSYQETDEFTLAQSKWDAQFDLEDSLLIPGLRSKGMQFQYATTQVQDQSLALECKLSYQSLNDFNASSEKWDAKIRAYGSGSDALPLEATLRLSSNVNDSVGVSLNYFVEF